MNKNSFAKEVNKLSLTRNDDYLFTTGNEKIDKAFGLGHEVLYGNPSMGAQINFGALVYLSGLFGGNISSFTATPFGFIYQMNFEDKNGVYVVSENEFKSTENNFLGFNVEDLKLRIEEFKKSNKLDENEQFFCDFVIRRLDESNEKPMNYVLRNVSLLIKENPGIFKRFEKNLRNARNSFVSTNNENCEKNNLQLIEMMYDSHIKNFNEEYLLNKQLSAYLTNYYVYQNKDLDSVLDCLDISEDEKNIVQNVLNKLSQNEEDYIMANEIKKWIIDGYYAHRGYCQDKEPVKKNKNIIHERAMDKDSKFRRIFKQDLKKILNMCSTDYTADRVYDVISIYSDSSIDTLESGKALDKVLDSVEVVEDNNKYKTIARRSFNRNINIDEK